MHRLAKILQSVLAMLHRALPNWPIGLAAALALLALLHYSLGPQRNITQLTLHLESEENATLELFSPGTKGKYRPQRRKNVNYRKGTSKHLVKFTYLYPEHPLRLDPTSNKGKQLVLKKLVITHMGISHQMNATDLKRHLLQCVQANCLIDDRGLRIYSEGSDPKVFIGKNLIPVYGLNNLRMVALGLSLLLFLLIGRNTRSHDASSFLLFILFCSAIASWKAYSLSDQTLVLSIINSLAIALTGVLGLSKLLTNFNHLEAHNRHQLASLLVTGSVLGTMIYGFLLAFSKPLWTDIQAYYTNKVSNAQQLHNLALQRQSLEELHLRHLPLRESLINKDAKAKIFGLGFTPNAKTILGEDGWYFEGYGERRVQGNVTRSFDNITDYMGLVPFSEAELKAWQIVLEDRYYWLKQHGMDYIFALAPTKAMIYPEKLPPRIRKVSSKLQQPSRHTQLIQYLQKHSDVPVIDLQTAMTKGRTKQSTPVYYKTDFHWNFLGAFYAYEALGQALNQYYPQHKLNVLKLEEFRQEIDNQWWHHNFLMMAGLRPHEHPNDINVIMHALNNQRYGTNSRYQNEGIDHLTMPPLKPEFYGDGKRLNVRQFSNNAGKLNTLFMLGDSFSEKMLPYLSAHAKEVYYYRALGQFLPELLLKHQPEIVVQEILSMYILNHKPKNPKAVRGAKQRYLNQQ